MTDHVGVGSTPASSCASPAEALDAPAEQLCTSRDLRIEEGLPALLPAASAVEANSNEETR